jgi:uncharacterized protein (TIGR02246 family)
MRKYAALLLGALVAGTLVTSAAASSASDQSGDSGINVICKRSLESTQRGFDQAFNDRDAHRLASFYRDEATLVSPRGRVFATRAVIETAFAGLFSTTFTSTVIPVRTVIEGCRTAVAITDFTIVDENGPRHFLASLTYTMDRGRWQVLLDQSTLLP